MTKIINFLEKNLNAIFVNIISGVAIVGVAGIIAWVCFTTSENSKDIVHLKTICGAE